LIYDEGLLSILSNLRIEGKIPFECIFKLSVHCGCANPFSAKIYNKLGADTINIVPDLDVPTIASFRNLIDCPLDIFSDTSSDAGSFLRTYEIPEIINYASPVYIKCGPISQSKQNHLPSSEELDERIKQTNVYTNI